MSYVVRKDQLERLARGELKVEDVACINNIALLSWSGIDVKLIVERDYEPHAEEVTEVDLELITDVLENCECSMCIESAISFVFDEKKKQAQCSGSKAP